MIGKSCRRLWQVEAARDGRLTGTELTSFEQHLARCAVCATEKAELEALGRALASGQAASDEMTLRRGRDRLLALVHGNATDARTSRRRWIFAPAAVVALLALVVLVRHVRRSDVPVADVVASSGARWERALTATSETLTLIQGTFTLTVRRSSPRRVAVVVPDGTIDDIGTIFDVSVSGGTTRGVVVREGAVVLRLRGREPVFLTAPATWAPPPATTTSNEHAMVRVPETIAPARTLPRIAVVPRRNVPAKAVARAPAVSADEDLAYLRIVALRREARTDEARIAAAEYLREFPNGFRRVEVLAFMRASR